VSVLQYTAHNSDYITKGGDLEGTKWKNAPFVGGRLKDTLESVFGDKKIGEVMKGVR
jgi:hypothetical protein